MSVSTITIAEMDKHVDEQVEIKGWLYHARAGGKVQFLMVRDGSGLCQAILEKTENNIDQFQEVKHLGQESAIIVRGMVHKDDRSTGGYELAATDIQIVHKTQDYPITPKAHGTDFLSKHRHLHLRSQRQWALGRLRHTIIQAIRDFFNNEGFILVDTPIFSPAAGEDEQTLFNVDYFGENIALSQTGQLYLEAAAMSMGKVYCFGPTFRAEKSKTRRHLTEFWMVEPEIAYIDLDGLLDLAERFVHYIVQAVLKDRRKELELLQRDITLLENITPPFVRLSYSDAVDILHSQAAKDHLQNQLDQKQQQLTEQQRAIEGWIAEQQTAKKQWKQDKLANQIKQANEQIAELQEQIENIPSHMKLAADFQWGKDLGGSDETIISQMHDKPVFVHRYPKDCKAFYMKPDPENAKVVMNFDCLAPQGYGEIIGGSMREDNYDQLVARINEKHYDPADYQWYLDLRRFGSVPHGGFGLGVERTVAWLAGIKHIRETIAFPRMMGKLYP